MSTIDDDGYPSTEILAIEEEHAGGQQSLWVGVRPIYHGSEPGEIMVQVCYQQHHNAGTLAGPVWLSPSTWRELNRAVEWRLRRHEKWWSRYWRKLKGQS